MALVPHNDLHILVIFEPILAFETLELYRDRSTDESLENHDDAYKATITDGYGMCCDYLRHRLQRSLKHIELVYFVSFAMPRTKNGSHL